MVVGQEYENGLIAYILKVGDVGFESNKIKGFIVSLDDISESVEFWSDDISNNNYTSTDLFGGALNTDLIIGGIGTMESAALLCKNYRGGGYTNWYLPSSSQLELIANIKYELQTLKEEIYLSSSEFDNGNYIGVDMTSLTLVNVEKSEPHFVRAVRDFELDISSKYVRMKFTDVYNSNYSDINYWNTFFNTEFVNYKVIRYDSYIEVTLFNGNDITLSVDSFKNNLYILSFESDLITIIPTNCFYNCQNLQLFNTPNVEIVGNRSFYRTYDLTSLTFNKVKRILDGGFEESRLTSILIPNCIYVGNNSFKNCLYLTSISLDSVINILDSAFQYCETLTTVLTPMLTSIGNYSFADCDLLTTINSKTCLSIGNYTFQNCILLTTVNLPLLMVVGHGMFNNCQGLLTISLPRVIIIGDYCFQNCIGLTTVYLPNLKTSGIYCFDTCVELTDVYIPLIEYVSQFMFNNCSGLLTLTAENCQYIDENGLANCGALTDISFPKLTSIKDSGLYSCGGLININIPLCIELELITQPAFAGCYSVLTLNTSKYLQYNNSGDEDGSIQQLRLDSGSVVVTFVSDLTNKLDNIGGSYPEYTDNADALANGRKVGQFYRTTDTFKVVH